MVPSVPLPRALVLGLSFPLIALNLWVFSSLYRAFEGEIAVFILAGVIALILNLSVRLVQLSQDLPDWIDASCKACCWGFPARSPVRWGVS